MFQIFQQLIEFYLSNIKSKFSIDFLLLTYKAQYFIKFIQYMYFKIRVSIQVSTSSKCSKHLGDDIVYAECSIVNNMKHDV